MTTATFVTNKGSFTVTLMPEHAPKTVENFVGLATGGKEWTGRDGAKKTDPLYPGTIFHRVIDGFMIQGGDPQAPAAAAPATRSRTRSLRAGRRSTRSDAWRWRTPVPARTARSSSSRSARPPWLNGKHTIFGQVTDGYDVVETIAKTPVGAQDKPVEDVVIERIDIAE